MICHELKGGIGTASRLVETPSGQCTVGVLVQANHGTRSLLRVDGVPVGREIDFAHTPSPRPQNPGEGSIIVVGPTTRRRHLAALKGELDRTNTRMVGAILNGFRPSQLYFDDETTYRYEQRE